MEPSKIDVTTNVASAAVETSSASERLAAIAAGAAFETATHDAVKAEEHVLEIDGFDLWYGDNQALYDNTMSIANAKVTALIGPSGCGKSTLLRFIGGLERPSVGEVLQIGEAPTSSLNPLTYIFQDFALLPWRTVEGNISLVLEDQGIAKAESAAIIDNVLERTKLTDFKAAWPRQLSGGMKQRVAIARALSVNPAVMLMDEPLSALDSQTRELLMGDLIELWIRERFTACYITHNLAEAVRLGHRIVVLSRRPGAIREIVEIDVPLEERRQNAAALAEKQNHLWELLRDEARAADEELANV